MATSRRKKPAEPVPEPDEPEVAAAPAPVVVALPEQLGYAAAGTLHANLLAVKDNPDVVLDASAVARLSTAGVLVLVSFLNAREAMTPPAAVINPPGPFVDAFSNLGLFSKLMRMEFRT